MWITLFTRVIVVPGGSRLTIPGQQEAILGPDGKTISDEQGIPLGVDQGMYWSCLLLCVFLPSCRSLAGKPSVVLVSLNIKKL